MKRTKLLQTSDQKLMNHIKNLYMITCLIGIFVSVFAFLISINIRKQEQSFVTQILTVNQDPCKYIIKLNYKNKPFEVNLTSPSGEIFTTVSKKTEHSSYTYTLTDSQMIIAINTPEQGDWNLNYNHAYHNNGITIDIKKVPYDGCYIENITTLIIDDMMQITFTPFAQTGKEHIALKGYALIEGNVNNIAKQTIMFSDTTEIITNQETTIVIPLTEKYTQIKNKYIRLVVYELNADKQDEYHTNILFHNVL